MNQTVDQLYGEYQDDLKVLLSKYQDTPGPFDEEMTLEDFIMRAEILKTLVALYADLAREIQP